MDVLNLFGLYFEMQILGQLFMNELSTINEQ